MMAMELWLLPKSMPMTLRFSFIAFECARIVLEVDKVDV